MRVPHPCTHPKPRTGSHTWGSPSHLLPGPARRAPQGRHHPGLCSVTPMPGPPPAGSPHTQGSEVWGRAEGGPQGLAHRRSSSTQFKRQWLMRHRWHEGACNQLIIFPQRLLRGGGGGAGGALHSSSDSRAGSLTPDDLSNLPGARVAVRMVPVRGARDPWRAAVPPHPPPIPQTLAPPLPSSSSGHLPRPSPSTAQLHPWILAPGPHGAVRTGGGPAGAHLWWLWGSDTEPALG